MIWHGLEAYTHTHTHIHLYWLRLYSPGTYLSVLEQELHLNLDVVSSTSSLGFQSQAAVSNSKALEVNEGRVFHNLFDQSWNVDSSVGFSCSEETHHQCKVSSVSRLLFKRNKKMTTTMTEA